LAICVLMFFSDLHEHIYIYIFVLYINLRKIYKHGILYARYTLQNVPYLWCMLFQNVCYLVLVVSFVRRLATLPKKTRQMHGTQKDSHARNTQNLSNTECPILEEHRNIYKHGIRYARNMLQTYTIHMVHVLILKILHCSCCFIRAVSSYATKQHKANARNTERLTC